MTIAALVLAAAIATLPDPAQEQRAQALEQEIRCVVCENEPISQSTADMAMDMRRTVRERIAAGESDEQVRRYFSERYGDFILLRPPFDPMTWLLWGGPLLLLAIGGAAAWRLRRPSGAPRPEPEWRDDDR
ncbi:MAG: cytochrome c-type biogenesis protein [Caulobacterales bacterium]|jgi:cytochrome c-type biogenesis protein CcmH